jgi:hypothetical protein
MGTTTPSRGTPSLLTLLAVRVRPETAQRVWREAKRIDQPVSAWLRMAIMEKLDRDGG